MEPVHHEGSFGARRPSPLVARLHELDVVNDLFGGDAEFLLEFVEVIQVHAVLLLVAVERERPAEQLVVRALDIRLRLKAEESRALGY